MLSPSPVSALADEDDEVIYEADGCRNKWLDAWKYGVRTHFMTVYAATGMKGTLVQGTESKSSFTLGVVLVGSKGGLSNGGTSTKSWTTEVTQNNIVDAHLWNETNYRKQTVGCTNSRTWRPYSLRDMFTEATQAAHNYYPHCATKLTSATWKTQGATSRTFTYGVKFPGWNVSAQSGFGTSQQLSFKYTRPGVICGNNDEGPAQSSAVDARHAK